MTSTRRLYKKKTAAILNLFNKMDRRRRTLILLLVATALFSGLFNTVYKPQRAELNKMKRKARKLKREAASIEAQIPDVAGEKQLLDEQKRSFALLQKELSALEAMLPHQSSLPRLLGELVSQASGYSIDFTSIKPITAKKKRAYDRLDIEMRFSTGYADLTNYLHRLENVSQFLNITKITTEKNEEKNASESDVTVVLSTLLGKDLLSTGAQSEGTAELENITLERDPFIAESSAQPEEETSRVYELTGIVHRGERSTAIIDGLVYKIGDVIGDKTVKEILANAVVLYDGKESAFLTMEKKGE